jgi:hypothetical protein
MFSTSGGTFSGGCVLSGAGARNFLTPTACRASRAFIPAGAQEAKRQAMEISRVQWEHGQNTNNQATERVAGIIGPVPISVRLLQFEIAGA